MSQISGKMPSKQLKSESESLHARIVGLKSFIVDQTHVIQKKLNKCKTSIHCDDKNTNKNFI